RRGAAVRGAAAGRHRGRPQTRGPRPAARRPAPLRGHPGGGRGSGLAAEGTSQRRHLRAHRRRGRPDAAPGPQAVRRAAAVVPGRGTGSMTDTGLLSVGVEDHSLWLTNSLPFVVRDALLTVVGRGTTGGPAMTLPVGLYSVEDVTRRGQSMQDVDTL